MMLIRAYTPAEFTAFISEADVDWRELVRACGAEVQAGQQGRRDGREPPEMFGWRKLAVNIPLWISKIKFGDY